MRGSPKEPEIKYRNKEISELDNIKNRLNELCKDVNEFPDKYFYWQVTLDEYTNWQVLIYYQTQIRGPNYY